MEVINYSIYGKYFKRPLDIIISFIALIILSPMFIVLALIVKYKLGSPIIYKQQRPGLHEKIFTLYKFRTMTNEKDYSGNLLPSNERLTGVGLFLRSTSLDELPEIFNILKGDMSFVGPRPLLIKYLPLYNKKQKRRHLLRPGLTGLAQINGRNLISWEEKFNLDVYYVKNLSFKLDIKIFLKTILKVLTREGINSNNNNIVEDFEGSPNQKEKP